MLLLSLQMAMFEGGGSALLFKVFSYLRWGGHVLKNMSLFSIIERLEV